MKRSQRKTESVVHEASNAEPARQVLNSMTEPHNFPDLDGYWKDRDFFF